MARICLILAAVSGLLAVIFGAFGAHALKGSLSPDELQWYETGNRYHFYHTFAMLASGVLMRSTDNRLFGYAAVIFLGGIFLFSGSLYVMAVAGIKSLGMITPLGGLAFIGGWAIIAAGLIRKNNK